MRTPRAFIGFSIQARAGDSTVSLLLQKREGRWGLTLLWVDSRYTVPIDTALHRWYGYKERGPGHAFFELPEDTDLTQAETMARELLGEIGGFRVAPTEWDFGRAQVVDVSGNDVYRTVSIVPVLQNDVALERAQTSLRTSGLAVYVSPEVRLRGRSFRVGLTEAAAADYVNSLVQLTELGVEDA
jgi:hypothetical protein